MSNIFEGGNASAELKFYGVSSFLSKIGEGAAADRCVQLLPDTKRGMAIGRIFVFREHSGTCPPQASIVCFLTSDDAEALPALLRAPAELNFAVGIIVACESISGEALRALMLSGMPFLVLDPSAAPTSACEGRIALLDAESGTLTVNPGLENINRYPLLPTQSEKASLPCRYRRGGNGIMLEDKDIITAGEPADILIRLAEESCTRRIIVSMSVPDSKEKEEAFCELTEAIYLAALYGNFSIMLKSYCLSSHITDALSLLKRAFCRLESAGREFNGYLKKGLLISSPLWLMQSPPIASPDFLCFDLSALSESLFGPDPSISSEDIDKLSMMFLDALSPLLSEYIPFNYPSIEIYAKIDEPQSSKTAALLSRLCSLAGFGEVYR